MPTLSPAPPPALPRWSQLRARLEQARATTDALFELFRPEAFYDRPVAERHRLGFYRGHFEAFDGNLLAEPLGAAPSPEPELDRLFAFGIDPVDGGLPQDQPADWPARPHVEAYVARARARLDTALDAARDPGGAGTEAEGFPAWFLLEVALEHRLMHAETFAYLLHELPFSRKQAPARLASAPEPPPAAPPAAHAVAIPAGPAHLGQARAAGRFGWDNEFEATTRDVSAFSIARTKVSNAEFETFVRAGGYSEPAWWTPEAWAWLRQRDLRHPHFWTARAEGGWDYRGMFASRPLPANWPVYVSHAEATAYARFRGLRLPTEAEWQRAALGGRPRPSSYPWGEAAPGPAHGNFDFQRWDPTPGGSFPAGASAFGVLDLLGNGWEWTADPFAPLPGFQPFPFYPGYSANFFDERHFVLKGGSPRTAACMLRGSFRNWFQPFYPYLYAGFRCVGPVEAASRF